MGGGKTMGDGKKQGLAHRSSIDHPTAAQKRREKGFKPRS